MSLEKTKKHEEDVESSLQNETKKCEGQLATGKANSCSFFKAVDSTAEMAQEIMIPCWDNLPSVILLEIFSYLPHKDRIQASQVCKNWRSTLFHPCFWKQIIFNFKDKDSAAWSRFLRSCFSLSVQEAIIRWNEYEYGFKEVSNLLKKLTHNRQLHKLVLEPCSTSFQSSNNKHYSSEEEEKQEFLSLMESVTKIAEVTNTLEVLSLGCLEEIAPNIHLILEPLKLNHAKHLTHLSLASVKDDPFQYEFTELDSTCFKSFVRLTVFTIDYEFVSDTLLNSLDNGVMQRLVIHVHGWEETYVGTSDHAWALFSRRNPLCQLRLSFIHAYDAVQHMQNILQPAMPLTHIKVLFSESINVFVLECLAEWYTSTLQSLIWIDSYTKNNSPFDNAYDNYVPDPLVLIAWKCDKLEELVLMGYNYLPENLICIVRLRDKTLKHLKFRERDFYTDGSWCNSEHIIHDIKRIMGENWKLLTDNELPTVMRDSYDGDSREVIMPLVLADQF